jgi:hypothetical protein
MQFDGYIRVSDTKGRSGERFLSPEIQRDTIRRLARENLSSRNTVAWPRPRRSLPASYRRGA